MADKILDEVMTDDELDNVAGGTLSQMMEIANIFGKDFLLAQDIAFNTKRPDGRAAVAVDDAKFTAFLKKNVGITADFGWTVKTRGEGVGSVFKDKTGQYMKYGEVIDACQMYMNNKK